MSETPVAPAAATPAAPALKLNALQMLQQQFQEYLAQREQAIARVHAVDGAIQAVQQTIVKLQAEAAKGVAAAAALKAPVVAPATIEPDETKVIDPLGKTDEVESEVNPKVVSIDSAKKTV